jgi:hypothetical protein
LTVPTSSPRYTPLKARLGCNKANFKARHLAQQLALE